MQILSWQKWMNSRSLHALLFALSIILFYFGLWNAYFYGGDDFYWTALMRHRSSLGEAAAGLENGVRFLNFAMIWVKTRLFDLNATLYLLSSLLQHIIVTYLLYRLIEVWTQRRPVAFLAALLFGTKFSYWEIVTSVSASDYSFWAIFYLMALGLFGTYLKQQRRALYAGSVAFYALLAFGHDFTLHMPLVLLAYHLILGRGNRPIRSMGWSDLKLHFPYWILWGIHVSIQIGYIVGGTSEAIYSAVDYGPGLHMIYNLKFLSALVIPNIPIYDRLLSVAPDLVAAIGTISAIVAVVGHALAIYGFWKGSPLVRFSLSLIYLPFLQYTLWHADFAGAPRYLYYPSIGFSILLALLLVRFYNYLQHRHITSARLVVSGVVAALLIVNFTVIQLWVQRNVSNSQLRRAFVTKLNAGFLGIEPEARVYIEVPEAKYTDLEFACILLFELPPDCYAFVSGTHSLEEVTSRVDERPLYWLQATDEGFIQIYPPVAVQLSSTEYRD